jgi:hypothetical protein
MQFWPSFSMVGERIVENTSSSTINEMNYVVIAVLSQSLIGLRAAMSLALPARRCYLSSRD